VLILAGGVEVYRGALGDIIFARPADSYDQIREDTIAIAANELITSRGSSCDTRFGQTRDTRELQPGQTPTPVTDLID